MEIPSFLQNEWNKLQEQQKQLSIATSTSSGIRKTEAPEWVKKLPTIISEWLGQRLKELGSGFVSPEDPRWQPIKSFISGITNDIKAATNNVKSTGVVNPPSGNTALGQVVGGTTGIAQLSPIERMQQQLDQARQSVLGMQNQLRGTISEAETVGGYKILYNAQGNRVEVGPNDEMEARNRGYTFASNPLTGGTTGGVAGTTPNQGLTQNDVINIITPLIDKYLASKPTIDPFSWTDEDTARVKAEFDEIYIPYYESQIAGAKRGTRESLEGITSTTDLALKRQERSLEEALSESRAAMAERGLAFSGIREQGEKKQQEVSTEEMNRIREVSGRARRDQLAQLEGQIGTSGVQSLYPDYQVAPEYQNLGIQFPRGTSITGIPGSIYSQKELDWQQDLSRRESEARQKYLSDILTSEYYS